MIAALVEALDAAGVDYEVLPHRHTETALAEAAALGVEPRTVAKTLIVKTPGGNVRAVLPASARLDLDDLAEHLGLPRSDIRLASEGEMATEYESFEVGAVPPLSGPSPERVVIDSRLTAEPFVVFEAGTHLESVRVGTASLAQATGGDVAAISRLD